MATRSTQNSAWANAAGNLGEALFPSGRTVAAGKIAGQQLSELAAKTRKTDAEAFGVEDQNSALAAAVLEAAGLSAREVAVPRAGRGNAQQIMESLQTSQQMGGDQSAADAFATGDFAGASAGRLRGGRDPLAVNKIEGGYQLNPYQQGGGITATSETLADILADQALVGQRNAAAGYDRERTANPERFRAPGSAGRAPEVTTAETAAMANEIARLVPKGTPESAILAAVEAASKRMLAGETPAAAMQGGVRDVFEHVPAVEAQDNWDFFGLGTPDVEAAPATMRPRVGPVHIIDPRHPESMQQAPPAPGRTPERVKADFQSGKISREQAKAELLQMGFK